MAINEMIALQGQVGNPLNALAQGYKLGEFISDRPVRADLNTIKVDQGRANVGLTKAQTDLIKTQREKLAKDSNFRAAAMGAMELSSTPFEQWGSVLQRRMAEGASYGYNADAEREALEMLQTNPEALKGQVAGLVKFGQEAGIFTSGQTAWQRQFDSMTQGMTPDEKMRAQRIAAGLDPRAVASAPSIVDIGGVKYVTNPMSGTASLPVLNQPIGGGNQQGAIPPPVPGGVQSQVPTASQPQVLDAAAVGANQAEIERRTKIAEGEANQQVQAQKGARDEAEVNRLLDEAEPLIDVATGSGVGRVRDIALGAVGMSTPAGDVAAQLRTIEGALIMKMPRMEGPQSNMDQQLYRQMAAQVGDPTVPSSQRKAAIQMLRVISSKYSNAENDGGNSQPAQNPGWSIKKVQ